MAGFITGVESRSIPKGTVLHTEVTVSLDGVDISDDINKGLISLSYTDNEEDEADDLQIKLEDHSKKWLGEWLDSTMEQAAENTMSTLVYPDRMITLANNFFDSPEFQANIKRAKNKNALIVDMIFNVMLDRDPDPTGKSYYLALLNNGVATPNDILHSVANSPEFNEHWDVAMQNSRDFVKKLYNDILGRKPDKAGFDYYVQSLGAEKGMSITAGVKQLKPNGESINAGFGIFELDQIRASGPPSSIQIKGTSLTYANGIRTDEKDKSWEGYTLSGIGAEIAGGGGLGFMYDCPDNPSYDRVEQVKQTDIAFLQQLCHDAGKSLKIHGRKLIIFDQAKYERMKSVTTIRWMDGTYTKYDLSTQSGEKHYDKCRVRYYDPIENKTYEGTATADDVKSDAKEFTVCTITDRKVGSDGEALALASKIIRLHNKYEKRVSFTMLGNPALCAGLTVNLDGFGLWDGKYIIKQSRHDISNTGYTTRLTLRTIPEGKVEVEQAEEKAAEQASGNTKSKKNKQVDKAWFIDEMTVGFSEQNGGYAVTTISKDQQVELLGNTNGEKTHIKIGDKQVWVNTTSLERREVKKDTKNGKQ